MTVDGDTARRNQFNPVRLAAHSGRALGALR